MAPTDSPLTVESLAETLRAYGEATDHRLQAVADRIEGLADRDEVMTGQVGALDVRLDALAMRVETLAGQIEALTGLIQDIGRMAVRHDEELREHRTQIRQILHRQEQHDARFEEQGRRLDEHAAAIRRLLDLLERRGGDGDRPAA